MALDSLRDLYVEELKDLYNAENQLLKALPRMAKAASSEELKAAFTEHLDVTQRQVERLDQIFTELGVCPKGKKCKAMEGLAGDPEDVQSRYIEGLGGNVRVGCLYLPNGNPAPGPKFDYKLRRLGRFSARAAELVNSPDPVVLAGD